VYTRFESLDDFFKAVKAETRHYRHVTDEVLSRAITEYQLWQDDSSPDKKPFEVEFRTFLETSAKIRRRLPHLKRVYKGFDLPPLSDADKHLYELFGIDWRPECVAPESKSA
jgi:hypothetical protein